MQYVFNRRRIRMAFVFFIYGLAFFIMGFAIFIYPKKDSAFKFAKSLWLIGAFGVAHGINEWIDMFILVQKLEVGLSLKVIRGFLEPLSFIFLVWFGTKVIAKAKKEFAWVKCLTFILPIAWVCIVVLTGDRFLYGDIWARYLLCFPGAILTAWGLILQLPNFKDIEFSPVKNGLRISAFSFIFYAIIAGAIVPKAGFSPAAIFNYNWFLVVFGFPIQVLRAVLAIMIAIFMGRILIVFDWESKIKLKESIEGLESINEELKSSKNDLQLSNVKLISTNEELRVAAEELQREKGFSKVITENIQEGIMLLSTDLKILWANKKTMDLTGMKDDDILGNYCYKVTHHLNEPCKAPHDICPVDEVLQTGTSVTILHTHFDKEGNSLYVEVTTYPVKNELGEVIQLIHVSRDITKRVELEEQLRKKLRDLERFNKLTVGRELKMRELKDRIKELEAKGKV
jgi:PAS domain S-box-containing protein